MWGSSRSRNLGGVPTERLPTHLMHGKVIPVPAPTSLDPSKSALFYGDNLDILRRDIPTDSVDLVYLDPPFNSNRSYSLLFREQSGNEAAAQMEAFDDTWTWSQESEATLEEIIDNPAVPNAVKDCMEALRRLLGDNEVLAYLVMMSARLVELRRVLKPTGSLWLHCDPTASHYLKIILDATFGPTNFRNEIIWQRTGSKGLMTVRLANNHDVLLGYQKAPGAKWNNDAAFIPYDLDNLDPKTAAKYSNVDEDGRRYELKDLTNPNRDRPNLTYEFLGVTKVWRWTRERMQEAYDAGRVVQTAPGRVPRVKRYLDEQRGKPFGDTWTDIAPLNSRSAERLGYPTQKPTFLLERLIKLCTDEGDTVLDPFCGCGTTVAAAQNLGRRWLGIDITTLAVDLIDKRMQDTYGAELRDSYELRGIPRDIEGAVSLFRRSPFEFERWAVGLVWGQPNERQVGDRGIDGVVRFPLTRRDRGRALVSVKGGASNPGHVRDLLGTIQSERAELGLFVCMNPPTRGMQEAANQSGSWEHPANGQRFPRIQILTIADLLRGARPNMPPAENPYYEARRSHLPNSDEPLFEV